MILFRDLVTIRILYLFVIHPCKYSYKKEFILPFIIITVYFWLAKINIYDVIWQKYSNEKYKNWNKLVTKTIRNHVTQCSYHQWYWKLRSKSFKYYIQFDVILHVIRLSFVFIHLSFVCSPMSLLYHAMVYLLSQ